MRVVPFDPDVPGDRGAVRRLLFHPSRPMLSAVVGAPDHFRELCRYRLDRDQPLPDAVPDESALYTPLELGPDPACSRDLELVATGVLTADGLPAVAVLDTWSAEQTELWFESEAENLTFEALAFSATGAHFFAAVSDATRQGCLLRSWNLEALFDDDAADAELDPFVRPKELAGDELPTALACDAHDRLLAVGTSAGRVWLCDPRREKPTRKLATVKGAVESLAFSVDDRSIVVTSEDAVTIVAARTGTIEMYWAGRFTAATFDATSLRVALVDADGSLRVWDRSGDLACELRPGFGPLHGVAASPDGAVWAVGGSRGTALLLDQS